MKNQKIKTRAELAVVAAAVIAGAVLLNYVVSRAFFRVDLTEDKQFTVSDATRQTLRKLDDIVTVKAFFSKELPPETHTTVSTARDLLNEYKNIAGGKLRVEWIDPAGSEEETEAARSMGVPEITLQTIKHDKAQAMKGYMGIGVMYAGRTEAIPVVQNLANLEYDLTQAIMKVRRSAAPKIGVLKTQSADFMPREILTQMNMANETTDRKFAPLFESLKRDYEVVAVDASEGQPIDGDIRTLIVPAGERFSDRVIFEIDQFLMNGGNLIALANAVGVSFQYGPQGSARESKLFELLEHYGIRVERGMVMDASCGHVQVPRNMGLFTINDVIPYPYFVRVVGEGFARDNPAVSGQSELMLGWASPLTDVSDSAAGAVNIALTALVSSSPQSWKVTEPFDLAPQHNYRLPPKEDMRSFTMAAHLGGELKSFFDGKPVPPARERDPDDVSPIIQNAEDAGRTITPSAAKGNIVVVGDANFITAQNASRPNVFFMQNIVDWLSLDINLIAIRSRALRDKTINANVLEEGSSKPSVIRWVNLLLMPLLVAIVGIIISLKRRERAAPAAAQSTSSTNNSNKEAAANG